MAGRKSKATPAELRSDFRKLGLDIRVVNALAAQGVTTLGDLAHLTDREFASFRGIGPNTRKLLQDYLKKESLPVSTPEPAPVSVAFPLEFLRAVDDWCLEQTERMLSRSEAIRQLVARGLARENS
jgi:hypothetical protein